MRDGGEDAHRRRWTPAPAIASACIVLLALIAVVALFGRIQHYPLRHDEQFYVPAGMLFSPGGLYRGFGYNQLPNLPILLHAVFDTFGVSHFLLAGRVVMFVAWLAACGVIAAMARRSGGSPPVALFAVACLLTNPVLLGPAGMTVTNNFIPVPIALAGLWAFLAGARMGRSGGVAFFLGGFAIGVAMGFKANYIFLVPPFAGALLLMMPALSVRERLAAVILPFGLGAMLGAMPILIYLAQDPDGFLAHVVRYHRGAQIEYWLASATSDDGKAVTMGQKLALAGRSWLLSAAGVVPGVILLLALVRWWPAGAAADRPRAAVPGLPLVFALIAFGCAISFVPTPAFPQYYVPPIGFAIVAIVMLYGGTVGARRAIADRILIGAAIVLAVAGAPRLLASVPDAFRPAGWSGVLIHRQARQLARDTAAGGGGPVATLAPLYPLEGGQPVYPELAAGFVLYRVGDYLRRTERDHYLYLASPATVEALLEREPPGAILVGTEDVLDTPFVAFARRHGYARAASPPVDPRRGALVLYVRPAKTRAAPAGP